MLPFVCHICFVEISFNFSFFSVTRQPVENQSNLRKFCYLISMVNWISFNVGVSLFQAFSYV